MKSIILIIFSILSLSLESFSQVPSSMVLMENDLKISEITQKVSEARLQLEGLLSAEAQNRIQFAEKKASNNSSFVKNLFEPVTIVQYAGSGIRSHDQLREQISALHTE